MTPRRRHDTLLTSAVLAFEQGDIAGALIAVECVCRSLPALVIAAVLRAKIVQSVLPGLASRAWSAAWRRDPEQTLLQDALLRALIVDGASAEVVELGAAFLPDRCQNGTHAPLVALLRQAGSAYGGACWKDETAIAVRLYAPGHVARCGLRLHGGNGVFDYEVPADGRKFLLPRPQGAGPWSLLLSTGAAPVLLAGSPLSFDALPLVPAGGEDLPAPSRAGAVTIVIPVYRGLAQVRRCIESVLASLAANRRAARLLVVDDATPEPALSAWLDKQARAGRLTLLRNPYNLGFIETVNRALRACPNDDAMLLNADTVVHGDWLDRLAQALDGAPDIGAVSPWSNNGEITSFPDIGQAAPMPDDATLRRIDMAAARLRQAGDSADVELPACCGFAMLMRRGAIESVGVLDGAALRRGYGEEVDWCLRARAAGYRTLAATGVYIAHAGGVSFRREKTLRVRQNRAVVAARYPAYYENYRQFLRTDPLGAARTVLTEVLQGLATQKQVRRDRRASSVPAALPGGCIRIGIYPRKPGEIPGPVVLRLARLLARRDPALPAVRLLLLGAASEAFWHTGVVDAIPGSDATDTDTDTMFDDATLIALTGCAILLAAPEVAVPAGIAVARLDAGFDPAAWFAAWERTVAPPPPLVRKQTA